MSFIIFFIYVPFVHSELHTFKTTYTGINGQAIAGIPEFSAVTVLDGQQIDYYDSEMKKLIPRQDWMKEFASTDMWKEDTEIRVNVQQIYKNNIPRLMERFNQSHGVHTYQRIYGCEWDDQTGYSQGFDQHGYDGEDFISLDVKELRYIASVTQAMPTVQKWNSETEQLNFLKNYYRHECVYWLKEFLNFSKATFKKTEPPKVSLLQNNPDYYVECHVTGFQFRETTVLWKTTGQDIQLFSEFVESGETLPNEDGTFQRTVALKFLPDDSKKDQFVCVVEHKSLTEPIRKNLLRKSALYTSYVKYTVVVPILAILILTALYAYWNRTTKYYYKKVRYYKVVKSDESEPAI